MAEPDGGGRPTVEEIAGRDLAAEEFAAVSPVVEEPRARFSLAPIRLAALGLALVLTIAITMVKLFVGGPPSVDDLRAQSGVDGWSQLTIGVKDDQPGVAQLNADGSWTGFDIDIAYMIAEDLGFRRTEVKFYAIESEDRARMQATEQIPGPDGKKRPHRVPVKMVIASYSITPDREQMAGVTFSVPYLYTEQSVVTLEGHRAVATLDDLRAEKVCTLSTSTSKAVGASVVRKNRVSECFKLLDTHQVGAVTTDAAILAGYKAKDPVKYHHWDLGLDATEAWGVNVGENPALKTLVDLTLYRSYKDPKDARWDLAYKHNLQVEEPINKGTPIAVAEQPVVKRPDVRVLPWETSIP
jgi:glutamate transport system substrate-binding protein